MVAVTSVKLAQSRRGWGVLPNKRFYGFYRKEKFIKCATVATVRRTKKGILVLFDFSKYNVGTHQDKVVLEWNI